MNYFLKAPDEAALVAALLAAGILLETIEPVYERQATGDLIRVVQLDNDSDSGLPMALVDPSESYLYSFTASGYKIVSDMQEPEIKSVFVGESTVYHAAPGYNIDVIGIIYKPTGAVQTVDGVEVPEMAAVPGWHANLRGELSDTQFAALEPILLEQPPAQPYRVWA